jgi:hypothetical protein
MFGVLTMIFTIRFSQSEGSFQIYKIYKNGAPVLRSHLGLADGSGSTFTWVEVSALLERVMHSVTNEKNEMEVVVG